MISWLAISKNPLFSKHVLKAVFSGWSRRLPHELTKGTKLLAQ